MARILVTGATGYVGKNLVGRLADLGYEIVATYRTECPDLEGVQWWRCDLQSDISQLPPVDYVIHCAVLHPLCRPRPNVVDLIEVNVNATHVLGRWAKDVGVKKFILLSTVSVHGTICVEELVEDVPMISADTYGITKYLSEKVLETFSDSYALCVFRLPGVVGPRIKNMGRPWLGVVLDNALTNRPIEIYNGNSLFNNVIDPSEIIKACVVVLESSNEKTGLFNLSASKPVPLKDMIQYIVNSVDSKSVIVNVDRNNISYSINIDRIRDILGIVPAPTMKIVNRYLKENV